MSRSAILDMSDDTMDRLFGEDQRRPIGALGLGLSVYADRALTIRPGPLPIEDFRRQPKARKVSAAKLAKRAKQKAQRNARKIARKATP